MNGGTLQVHQLRPSFFPILHSTRAFLSAVVSLLSPLPQGPVHTGRVPYIVGQGTTGCGTEQGEDGLESGCHGEGRQQSIGHHECQRSQRVRGIARRRFH